MLFTLIAERYERRSMLITSNLVFSEWERIFKDPMATAAAIDRLVHHAVDPGVQRAELSHPKTPTDRCQRNRRKREREAGLTGRDATVTLRPRSGSRPSPSPLMKELEKEGLGQTSTWRQPAKIIVADRQK